MRLKAVIAGGAAILFATFGGSFALSSGTGADCGTGTVDTATASASFVSVAGYSGDQLVNAGLIMNAATTAGLPQRAQILGVMTAIGESSLRNITYGDAVYGVTNPDGTATTSVGLFQQQASWGSEAARLDPTQAAGLFFARLAAISGWETMTPSAAAHAVQRNADPDHYTRYFEPAAEIVRALTATSGGGDCVIGDEPQALAQELVTHADDGTLRGTVPDHIKEIRWIAQGRAEPGCGIDTAILQVMVVAVRNFATVGVSDINRNCTRQTVGAGTASRHYTDGGGYAVDFYMLDGTSTTGADANSIRLIGLLDPVMLPGSRVGQADCRANQNRTLALTNLTQFDDTCTHLHIDVPPAQESLRLS